LANVLDAELDFTIPPFWGFDHAALAVSFNISVLQSSSIGKMRVDGTVRD